MKALELFKKVQGKLGDTPALPFLDAVDVVSQAITRVLLDLKSDCLNKTDDEIEVGVGATVDLPAEFRGFACLPYCVEARAFLEEVPDEVRLSATGTALLGYDLRGRKLSLVPAQAAAKTLKVAFFAAPSAITTMGQDLPFDGLFDFLFVDCVVTVSEKGLEVTSDPAFQKHLDRKVSDIIMKRKPVTRRRNGYFD